MNTTTPSTRRRAELFGLICGVAGGVLAANRDTSSMALFTVGSSILAGAVGNYFAGEVDDPGLRPRAGIRAGVVAALVSGATAIACFTLKSGGFAAVKIIPALLAIPPGAFFGLFGSLIVSMIQNPQVRPMGQWEPKQTTRPSALLVIILLLSAIGYASPFIAAMMPARITPTVEFTPTPIAQPMPSPTPEPRPVIAPPPPWRYEAPANFADARPSQLKVQREVSLGRFDSPLRYLFLDDNRRLAFVRPDSSIISVELNAPDTRVVFPVPESPERFALSRDFKKVFCIGNRGGLFVTTVDGAVRLPIPSAVPAGTIVWDSETQVFIGSQRLDLETLRLLPSQETTSSPPLFHPNIRLRQTNRIMSAEEQSLRGERLFFFRDEKRDYSGVASFHGESPFLSTDATKLFFVRDGELFVRYLETGSSREMKFTATMPEAPPAAISDALNARALVVMLCPPIINPLNRKTVGADLSRIKALIGIESWTGTTATMWLKEDYGEIPDASDVVAFIGKIENGRIVPLPQFADWWSPILDVKSGDAPERIAPVVPKEPPKLEPSPPVYIRENPPKQNETPLHISLVNALRDFIREHHAKSSRNDVEGLMASYAERVEHFDKGVVSREVIRAEETEYHGPGVKTSEVLAEEPKLSALGNDRYAAKYTIRFDRSNSVNRKWSRGFADIELTIAMTNMGPRIVRQNAKTRVVEKGP